MGNGAFQANASHRMGEQRWISRRTLLTGAAATAGLIGLSACSTGPSGGTSSGGAADELSLWVISSFTTDSDSPLSKALAKYTEKTGTKVRVESFDTGTFKDKLLTAVQGGNGPDVASVDSAWIAQLAAAGAISDISKPYAKVADAYFEGAAATGNFEGKQFALPWYTNNVALYYNRDMFDAAGIADPPATWDEFRSTALALTKGDQYGLMLGANWYGPFLWWSFLWQNGGEILDDDGRTVLFNSKEGHEAWKFYSDLYLTDHVVPETFLGVTGNWDQYWTPFAQGKVGMMMVGDWAINALKESAPDLNFEIAPLPANTDKATVIGGYDLAIPSSSTASESAMDFMAWLSSAENAGMLAEYGRLPALQQIATDPDFADGELKVFVEQADVARSRPVVAAWPEVEDIVATAWDSVLQGQKDPAQALDDAAAAAEKALA